MPQGSDKQFVRLVCVLKDDVTDKFPITFEVTLQRKLIAKRRIHFGFQGSLNGDEFHPFVLRPDGNLDFGSDYEADDDRYIRTNILEKKIELGTIFTTRERDPETDRPSEHVYLVKQIVTL